MMRKIFITIFCVFAFISLKAQKQNDIVHLYDGTILEGIVIERTNKTLFLVNPLGYNVDIQIELVAKYYKYEDDKNTFVWINENPPPEDILEQNITGAVNQKSKNYNTSKVFDDQDSPMRSTQYGVNMASFASQFIPLRRSTTLNGPYNFLFRVGSTQNLFTVLLGIESDSQFGDLTHFNLSLGYTKVSKINEKFNVFNNFSLMGFSGSFNDPTSPNNNDIFGNDGGAGIGVSAGLEYELYKNIYLGTETILFIGAPAIDFIPPVSLYLIAKINR